MRDTMLLVSSLLVPRAAVLDFSELKIISG